MPRNKTLNIYHLQKKRRVVSSGYGTEEDTTSENIERSMLKRKRSDEDTNPDEPVKSRFRFGIKVISGKFALINNNFITGDLDKYQKIIQIGEGTFGRVYKAREHSTRKIFAIKEFVMSKGDYKTDVGVRNDFLFYVGQS